MPISDVAIVRGFLGLDLGQVNDRSALVVLMRTVVHSHVVNLVTGERPVVVSYDLRFTCRWPLGTAYPAVVSRVVEIADNLSRAFPRVGLELAYDGTGVGRAVGDLLRDARWPSSFSVVPISITAGDVASERNARLYVPKRDLVSSLVVLFQSGALKISAGVSDCDVLVNELVNFRGRMSAGGRDSYGNSGGVNGAANDDLVSACAFAAYRASLLRSRPRTGPLLSF